jgi:hypothetical protein
MKLGKEEIQKIFLSFLMLIGLLYCYFNMLLGPLNEDEIKAQKTISDLTPQIEGAKQLVKDVQQRETLAPAHAETLARMKSLIPEGSPIAWFPPGMVDFFNRHGIKKCIVHLGGEGSAKDLDGFKTISCSIDLPQVEMVPQLGTLIADFENEKPLMEIHSIHIEGSKDLVQFQSARLNVSTIIKQ